MPDSTSIRGSRAQQFAARHEVFLELWAEGLHPLEIARQLGLSNAQLAKHTLKAFEDTAPRKRPEYDCLPWEELPAVLRKALPSTDTESLVKVEAAGDGVILTLIVTE